MVYNIALNPKTQFVKVSENDIQKKMEEQQWQINKLT
jgi:hypothetical protein